MDVLDSTYYRTNKFLLTCLGQWPYQDPLHKRIIRTLIFILCVSIIVPEILRLIDIWGELDYVIECISILGVQMSIAMKFFNYVLNEDKILILTNHIQNDWKFKIIGPELEILKSYAEEGKKLTDFYSVCMYSNLATYLIMPMVPKFLDFVVPLNESRPITFPIPTKYGDLDTNTYYLPITLHNDCVAIVTLSTMVAMDATYTVYVQHACGLFAVLGHKLKSLKIDLNEDVDQINFKRQEKLTYRNIITCVKMHKDAIEFANMIESSHTLLHFIVMGLTVICVSISGYQMVMNFDKPNEELRFTAMTVAHVFHIFFLNWPGQKLIDHSGRIHDWVYRAQWYNASTRSKKLLMLMMMRSQEPCKITAGKLFIMSFANFSMIIRTSMSYFTVLTSFR